MKHDVVVIGGGPAGYVAAIRMAQLGLRVTLVEKGKLGGVCLHRGCVPTKALYAVTKTIARARDLERSGVAFAVPTIDLPRLAAWKDEIVGRLAEGVVKLVSGAGVTVVQAEALLAGPGRVALSTGETLEAERIVLATGSSPMEIPRFRFSDPLVWSSDDALAVSEVPERLLVIGGGVIGLELATIYRRLGSQVTVIELLKEILPGIDLGRRGLSLVRRSLAAQGIAVNVETGAESIEGTADGAVVRARDGRTFLADRVLLAVGRRPNSSNLGLETVGVEPDRRGVVPVNAGLETTAEGVFAIGDLVPGPMLAHKASADALKLAASFAGEERPLDYALVPQAIFTDPEVAVVGLSEERAKEEGRDVLVGRFPYASLGKAQGQNEPDGLFQVVADRTTHRVLGVQIVGTEASDLVSEGMVAVWNGLSLEAIADAVHPHPTLAEGLKEAAENALGRAIHIANR